MVSIQIHLWLASRIATSNNQTYEGCEKVDSVQFQQIMLCSILPAQKENRYFFLDAASLVITCRWWLSRVHGFFVQVNDCKRHYPTTVIYTPARTSTKQLRSWQTLNRRTSCIIEARYRKYNCLQSRTFKFLVKIHILVKVVYQPYERTGRIRSTVYRRQFEPQGPHKQHEIKATVRSAITYTPTVGSTHSLPQRLQRNFQRLNTNTPFGITQEPNGILNTH